MNINHSQKCVEQCYEIVIGGIILNVQDQNCSKDSRKESHTNSAFENGIMSLGLESEEKTECISHLSMTCCGEFFGGMDRRKEGWMDERKDDGWMDFNMYKRA